MKTVIAALLLAISSAALTEEKEIKVGTKFDSITLQDETVLEDAKITRYDPHAVYFFHKSGVARVDYENLPSEIRDGLGYDTPAAVEARRKQVAAAKELNAKQQRIAEKKAQAKARAKAERLSTFKVYLVEKKGIYVQEHIRGGLAGSAARALGRNYVPSETKSRIYFLRDCPTKGIVDDDIIDLYYLPTEETKNDGYRTVRVLEFSRWKKPAP